jgi:hypothetical protein
VPRPRVLVLSLALQWTLGQVARASASGAELEWETRLGTAAALALITVAVSNCPAISTIDTLALRPDGHQHEQRPAPSHLHGRAQVRQFNHDGVGIPEEKKLSPLVRHVVFRLCKICIRTRCFHNFQKLAS